MGPSKKVKEAAAQVSMIARWTMARAHKAAVAAEREEKDRKFKAYQQELGLSSDDNEEKLAPSTSQKAATWGPVA
jgi:hypothetical protein